MLEFLQLQKLGLTKSTWNKIVKTLLKLLLQVVVKAGRKTVLRIIRNERQWIQTGIMTSGRQGKTACLISLLNDEDI